MDKTVPWTSMDLIHAILLMIASMGLIIGLLSFVTLQDMVFGLNEVKSHDSFMPTIFIVLNGLILLIVWYFTLRKYNSCFAVLGLRNPILPQSYIKFGMPQSFLTLIGLPALVLVVSILFTALYTLVVASAGWEVFEPSIVDDKLIGYGNIRLANIIIIGLWGPFAEELFFRGFLLPGLVNKLGKLVGILIVSLLFALAHLSLGSFLPIFVIGILLASLYLLTRSIWPGLVVHSFQNSIVILMSFTY